MSQEEKWLEEISSYLDGQSSDKKAVEERMQQDASLAQRGKEYARMGALLRSLPDPDVHPAFATRVVAHAVESNTPRSVRRWWQVLLPAMGLAAVVVYAVSLQFSPGNRSVSQPTAQMAATISPQEPITLRTDWSDEERVVGEIERLIDQGESLEVYGGVGDLEAEVEVPLESGNEAMPEVAEVNVSEPLSPEWSRQIAREIYAYVSDPYWNSPESEVLWFRPDVDQEVNGLSAPERRLFEELLRVYQENG